MNVANVRLADRTESHRYISVCGAIMCLGALVALIAHIAADRPADLILLGGLIALTYLGEATYQHRRRRRPLAHESGDGSPG